MGGLTSWLGFGDAKDPKTTQEGMLGSHPDVDYGAVYRDIGGCFFISSISSLSRISLSDSATPLLIGRQRVDSVSRSRY